MTKEQEAEIRKVIGMEDDARQDYSPPMSQNARHRRILLAEVERLRAGPACTCEMASTVQSEGRA
jgi:hypothetical protein